MKKLSLLLLVALVAFVAACSTITTDKAEAHVGPIQNVDFDLSSAGNF